LYSISINLYIRRNSGHDSQSIQGMTSSIKWSILLWTQWVITRRCWTRNAQREAVHSMYAWIVRIRSEERIRGVRYAIASRRIVDDAVDSTYTGSGPG
jgi:hypothetical protein